MRPSLWGEVPVADAHVHFFSHRFFTMLAVQRGRGSVEDFGPLLGWSMPPEDPKGLAADWVAELDRHGVDRAVLIASLPGDQDSVLEAVGQYPARFHGFFMVNPLAPDAPAVVDRTLGAGLRGICLFPAMHSYPVKHRRVLAVLEAAAGHPSTVAFVHCGVLSVGVRKKLGLSSLFDMSYSNPIDLHGAALRFPQLKFIVPHFGAGYFREALMLCDLCPNVYLDTSSSNSWVRYQEEGCTLAGVFRRALAVAGARRLLFGTDSSFFPRGWHSAIFEEQARILADLGVTAEDAAAIFGGNLARLVSPFTRE